MHGQKNDSPDNPSGITERFEIAKLLTSGKTSMAYKAVDKVLKEEVTVKTIASKLIKNENLPEFNRDLKAISNIDHDSIAKVFDYGQTRSGKSYMVLEYIEGISLEEYLKKNGALKADLAISIVKQLCDALSMVHEKGISHRDLKPSNIFLVEENDGTTIIPVIVDFGFGHIRLPNDRGIEKTIQGNFAGNPIYMSPEQITGQEETTTTDIYSLGCIFYELLTGLPPFKGRSPEETFSMHLETDPPPIPNLVGKNEKTRSDLEEIIFQMLAINPQERPKDAIEIFNYLSALEPVKKKSTAQSKSVSILTFLTTTVVISLVLLAASAYFSHHKSKELQASDIPLTRSLLKPHLSDKNQKQLEIKEIDLRDQDVKDILTLAKLEELSIGGARITKVGLNDLLRLANIKKINIYHSKNVDKHDCADLNAKFGKEIVSLVD